MDSLSDADIIARSIGDSDLFAEIFERHFDSVYAYLVRRVGPDIGGDLTADVFLAAFESRRRYDLTRPISRPWLLGIVWLLIGLGLRRAVVASSDLDHYAGERIWILGKGRRQREPLSLPCPQRT